MLQPELVRVVVVVGVLETVFAGKLVVSQVDELVVFGGEMVKLDLFGAGEAMGCVRYVETLVDVGELEHLLVCQACGLAFKESIVVEKGLGNGFLR